MTYKTIVSFRDAQDKLHLYRPGDPFPRDGVSVTAARLAELSGSQNALGIPLIKAVAAPAPAKPEASEPAEAAPAPAKPEASKPEKPAKAAETEPAKKKPARKKTAKE